MFDKPTIKTVLISVEPGKIDISFKSLKCSIILLWLKPVECTSILNKRHVISIIINLGYFFTCSTIHNLSK